MSLEAAAEQRFLAQDSSGEWSQYAHRETLRPPDGLVVTGSAGMKLSEARILYLARESLARLRDEGLAEIPNFALALRQARELIAEWNDKGDEIDALVRRKITSIKRGIAEGSNEWTLLYRRYRDEELRKRGILH